LIGRNRNEKNNIEEKFEKPGCNDCRPVVISEDFPNQMYF
jgi:hypothetical protein